MGKYIFTLHYKNLFIVWLWRHILFIQGGVNFFDLFILFVICSNRLHSNRLSITIILFYIHTYKNVGRFPSGASGRYLIEPFIHSLSLRSNFIPKIRRVDCTILLPARLYTWVLPIPTLDLCKMFHSILVMLVGFAEEKTEFVVSFWTRVFTSLLL